MSRLSGITLRLLTPVIWKASSAVLGPNVSVFFNTLHCTSNTYVIEHLKLHTFKTVSPSCSFLIGVFAVTKFYFSLFWHGLRFASHNIRNFCFVYHANFVRNITWIFSNRIFKCDIPVMFYEFNTYSVQLAVKTQLIYCTVCTMYKNYMFRPILAIFRFFV